MSEPVDVGTLSDDELVATYESLDPNSEDGDFLFAEMVLRGLDNQAAVDHAKGTDPVQPEG